MGWIKDANKIGEYQYSYKGFRFYLIKKGMCISYCYKNEEGNVVTVTDIEYDRFTIVDKTGYKFEDVLAGDAIWCKIDWIETERYFVKKDDRGK